MYLFTYLLKKTKCHCPEGKACVYGLNVLCSKVHISNVVSSPVSSREEMAWGTGSWAVLFLTPFSLSVSSLLLRTSAACEILHSYWEPSNYGLKPLKPWDKINAFSFVCFCLIFYHSNRNVSRTLVRPSRSGKPFLQFQNVLDPRPQRRENDV